EGILCAHRLRGRKRLDRRVIAAEGELVETLAVPTEPLDERSARIRLELPDRREAEASQLRRHHLADAPDPLDRQRREEARLVTRGNRAEAAGLSELGGALRPESARGEPSRGREAGRLDDPCLDAADGFQRAPVDTFGAGEIDEGLIDRDRLDQR